MYRVILPGAVVESGDAAEACVPRSPFPVLLREAERLMHVGSPHNLNILHIALLSLEMLCLATSVQFSSFQL